MVTALDEYAQLPDTQRSKFNKNQLKAIIDNQLQANQAVAVTYNTNDIREVLSDAINTQP